MSNISKVISKSVAVELDKDECQDMIELLKKVFSLGVGEGMIREGCSGCGQSELEDIIDKLL